MIYLTKDYYARLYKDLSKLSCKKEYEKTYINLQAAVKTVLRALVSMLCRAFQLTGGDTPQPIVRSQQNRRHERGK